MGRASVTLGHVSSRATGLPLRVWRQVSTVCPCRGLCPWPVRWRAEQVHAAQLPSLRCETLAGERPEHPPGPAAPPPRGPADDDGIPGLRPGRDRPRSRERDLWSARPREERRLGSFGSTRSVAPVSHTAGRSGGMAGGRPETGYHPACPAALQADASQLPPSGATRPGAGRPRSSPSPRAPASPRSTPGRSRAAGAARQSCAAAYAASPLRALPRPASTPAQTTPSGRSSPAAFPLCR